MDSSPSTPCSPEPAAPCPAEHGHAARFATTRWSIVARAGKLQMPDAHEALEHLCRTYWYPLYAHVRRRGYAAADAQDLTQDFFARLLACETLAAADPGRGRFRSFILTVLDRFLADEWDKSQTQKRGGGYELLSLDLAAAERRFEAETPDNTAPDQAFDRQWAMALLDAVLMQLEKEYQQKGQQDLFAALKPTLIHAHEPDSGAELATRLNLNEGAVRVAIHRLRKRYRALLEAEIDETAASPEEAQEELRHLFRTVGGS